MGRKVISVWLVVLLLFSILVVIDISIDITSRVGATTWYVDDVPGGSPSEDFTSIQAAINATSPGDTVYVYSGTYYEKITVDKSVSIVGEDNQTTIIDGSGCEFEVVKITSDWVAIQYFKIIGDSMTLRIHITSNLNTIAYNNILGQSDGCIYLNPGSNNTIKGNTISGGMWAIGGAWSSYNIISDNTITKVATGIGFGLDSIHNNIRNNNISSNPGDGVQLFSAHNNTVQNNILYKNMNGINIDSSNNNLITENDVIDSDWYGLSIVSSSYNTVTNNNISYSQIDGGIRIISSSNNNINDNELFYNDYYNIFLQNSNNNQINDNIITGQDYGIYIDSSSQNTLIGNLMYQTGLFLCGNLLDHWNTHNIDISNTVNDKPVYYWKNQTGGSIPLGAGEIILANCTDVNIDNQYLLYTSVGIEFGFSSNNAIINTTLLNNYYYGIYLYYSNTNKILWNNVTNNDYGIYLIGSKDNEFTGNNVSLNYRGIDLHSSDKNNISLNTIYSNTFYGIRLYGAVGNNISANNMKSNNIGIRSWSSSNNLLINCSIINSSNYDFQFNGNSHITTINTTFNKVKIYFSDTSSTLTVNWYLHVNVTNVAGEPIPNALVCIKDNINSLPPQWYRTETDGYVRWLIETEYIKSKNRQTYHTPHKISAWNETLMGYAEVNMNESKEVNVVLDTPYHEIPLYKGWNMVSLPLVQPDTSIPTVLGSIAGNYDKVEWYNTSEGIWHTTDDDLTDLDHIMGFWIHMKTDDTLIVTGDIPNTTSIQLYQGWNLVGNPSFCIHGFDEIFASISDNYSAVQWFDAGDKGDPWKHYNIDKPQELNDLKYITCGRGYWIYVDQDCVWEVNNFK